MQKTKKIQGKKNRDIKGRFVKGHIAIGSVTSMLEHNRVNGVWKKGKKLAELSLETRTKQSQAMQERHRNPSWNEKERRKKISSSLKGHEVTNKTKSILKTKAKSSRMGGIRFEYRAKRFLESLNVKEVIRSGGSKGIDLTVIWEDCSISKEEVKSSFSWFNTLSKNPLTLLDKYDKEKLRKAYEKNYRIFLIFREPKVKNNGELMEKQSWVRRIELLFNGDKIIRRNHI